jgi:hypothetical protein
MMISQVTQSAQQMQMNLADLDVQTAAKNAIASSEIARGAAAHEGIIVERQNQNKMIEVEQKRQMWSNFSKLAASTAGAVGQFVKAGETANWWQKTPVGITSPKFGTPEYDTSVAQTTGIAGAFATANNLPGESTGASYKGTTGREFDVSLMQKNVDAIASGNSSIPYEFAGYSDFY